MKIKAVCEKTGLTDRTVRYYIEEGLITPSYTENYLGRKSFDFEEKDIAELCEISTLRSFDFSIEEIKHLKRSPESSRQVIEKVKERIEEGARESERKYRAISLLDVASLTNASEIASGLLRTDGAEVPRDGEEGINLKTFFASLRFVALFAIIWLPLAITLGVTVFSFVKSEYPVVDSLRLFLCALTFLPSMLIVIISAVKPTVNRAKRTVLTAMCALCVPASIVFSSGIVKECPHSWDVFATEKEASCTEEGKLIMRCDGCGGYCVEAIPAVGHKEIRVEGIAPTCTEGGLSDGIRCSVCDQILKERKSLETVEHMLKTVKGYAPTCEKEGLGDRVYCAECGYVALEAGVIPKAAHTFSATVISPTCGAEGYTEHVCECGESYRSDIAEPVGDHRFIIAPDGTDFICAECGLLVCEYGNVGNSVSNVKYYIEGDSESNFKTLVIYGEGDMPALESAESYPWYLSYHRYGISDVVIEKGVASIAKDAFAVSGDYNPYTRIVSFTVRNRELRIDGGGSSIGGICCDITYK